MLVLNVGFTECTFLDTFNFNGSTTRIPPFDTDTVKESKNAVFVFFIGTEVHLLGLDEWSGGRWDGPSTPCWTNIAGWTFGPFEDVFFLLKMGKIPASHVSLPEGRPWKVNILNPKLWRFGENMKFLFQLGCFFGCCSKRNFLERILISHTKTGKRREREKSSTQTYLGDIH